MRMRSFCVAALSALLAGLAWGSDPPPLRIVVPVPAGGSLDTTARLLARELQARHAPAFVENRPGANTLLGSDAVARAAPDGNTILYSSTTLAIAPLLQKNWLNDDALVPVIQVSQESFLLAVRSEGGPASIDDLRRLSAERPGGINCISVPGVPEVACAQLRLHLNGQSVTVPYPGLAQAGTALLAGQGDVMFSPAVSLLPLLRAGRVRVLAVSSRAALPDSLAHVPLLSDIWKDFAVEGFTGIFVARATPEARLRQLNTQIDSILRDPQFRATMRANGQEPIGGPPEVLAEQFRRARSRYQDAISRMGVANLR